MRIPSAALLLCAVLCPSPLSAQTFAPYQSGTEVARECESDLINGIPIFCYGYLMAIVDASLAGSGTPLFCVPPNLQVDGLRQAFLQYSRQHPLELHKFASVVARDAFMEAFPYSEQCGEMLEKARRLRG